MQTSFDSKPSGCVADITTFSTPIDAAFSPRSVKRQIVLDGVQHPPVCRSPVRALFRGATSGSLDADKATELCGSGAMSASTAATIA
jgi:hypothetical protein